LVSVILTLVLLLNDLHPKMNDYPTIKTQVLKIIEKYAFNKELVKEALDDSRIIADLKINSARIVDIILDIEDQYNVEIDDQSIEKMIRVKDAVEIILTKINA
jgi:acyl carrier protein